MTAVPDLSALFERIPAGWSRREYTGRPYGVTRTVSAGGRIQKIFAEELGGTDIVSANLYLGDRFRPCEMPARQVVAFLTESVAATGCSAADGHSRGAPGDNWHDG